MMGPRLILILLVGVVASFSDAVAEKVKSNQETKLFARPGERAKVLLTVSNGKAMTVLAKEGRWLKVRVSGRTGYVARSTVDMPEGDEIARNTRRRSFVDGRGTKRGFGAQEGPDDRIGADAIGEGREDGGDEPAKKGGDDEEEEEEEEEDDPPAKTAAKGKPAAKTPPAKTKAPAKSKGGDDEEDEDENPLPKAKTVAAKTPPKKGGDDEEDEDDEDDGDARPRAKIARKTTVFTDPDTKSEKILVATADTPLFLTGEKSGKFTEVETDDADLGYVLTADIAGQISVKEQEDEGEDEEDEPAVARGGSQIDLRARAGVTLLSQALRSPGGVTRPPDNYNISTSAVTLAVGVGYYRPFKKSMILGSELTYDYANAFGGFPVEMGAMKTTTKISVHNLNVRGVIGLDFKKASGMMLLGRLGVRYHSYQISDATSIEKNLGRFPSEIITSPMIGVAFAMPRLTNKFGLRFSLDFMPLNFQYKQTKNLEDGKSPSAKGAVVGTGLTYQWKKNFDIQATYDLNYTAASFGAKLDSSMRGHPMGGVKRTDVFHVVTAGIVKAF